MNSPRCVMRKHHYNWFYLSRILVLSDSIYSIAFAKNERTTKMLYYCITGWTFPSNSWTSFHISSNQKRKKKMEILSLKTVLMQFSSWFEWIMFSLQKKPFLLYVFEICITLFVRFCKHYVFRFISFHSIKMYCCSFVLRG